MPGNALLTLVVLACAGVAHSVGPNILSQIFADLKQGYRGQLSDLHAEFNRRQTEIEGRYRELEEKYNSLLNILQVRKRDVGLPPDEISDVSFYAQLSHDLSSIGNFQPIVFDVVTTNNGNGYNRADGIFTVPTSGTYVFSWTAANVEHTHMQTELVVDANVYGTTWSDAYDHNDVAIGSNTVILNLYKGETVWIRSNSKHSGTITGRYLSTFSGWLLH